MYCSFGGHNHQPTSSNHNKNPFRRLKTSWLRFELYKLMPFVSFSLFSSSYLPADQTPPRPPTTHKNNTIVGCPPHVCVLPFTIYTNYELRALCLPHHDKIQRMCNSRKTRPQPLKIRVTPWLRLVKPPEINRTLPIPLLSWVGFCVVAH